MKKLHYYHQGKPSSLPLPEQMKRAPLHLYKKEDLQTLLEQKRQQERGGLEQALGGESLDLS